MRSLKFLVASSTFVVLCSIGSPAALANDAPVNLQAGGLQALAGAVYAISMDTEVVKIVLGKKSYVVDATFNFLNEGDTMRVDVGFPRVSGSGLYSCYFLRMG